MHLGPSLASGFLGALALTAVHETVRRVVPEAPHVHRLGERVIARLLRAADREVPDREALYAASLAEDVASNAAYYALVGLGGPEGAPRRGALLGLGAGAMALALPGPLGLGTDPVARTPATRAMTVAWYTLGGVAAGVAFRSLARA